MTTSDARTAMLDERYGRRHSLSRRRGQFLAAIAIVVAILAVVWFSLAASSQTVDSTETAFHLVNDHEIELSFRFTAPKGADVACALEAQNDAHATVGWKVVRYGPQGGSSQTHTETIPLTAPATTGFVNTCWVP